MHTRRPLVIVLIAAAAAFAISHLDLTRHQRTAAPLAAEAVASAPADSPVMEQAAPPAKPAGGTFSLLALLTGGAVALGSVRTIQDARLNRTVALPAAGATADSAAIEIGTGPHVEDLEVQIVLPATPIADAKNVTLTLQHSADGATNWAAIPGLSSLVATGAGGTGAAAAVLEDRLPSSFLGYLRLHAAVDAAGGDNTAVIAKLNILN